MIARLGLMVQLIFEIVELAVVLKDGLIAHPFRIHDALDSRYIFHTDHCLTQIALLDQHGLIQGLNAIIFIS